MASVLSKTNLHCTETDAASNNDTLTTLDNKIRQHDILPSFQNKAGNDTEYNTDSTTISKDKCYIVNEASRFKNYCGLRNQGATCYLNAVLQTLFMTQEFRGAVMELKEHNGKEIESVSRELQIIFKCLTSSTENVTTKGMTKALNITDVHEQQDAAEYYQKILSEIEPETAKIFQGKIKHSNICLHGYHEYITENSFFSLAIAVDSDITETNVQNSFAAQFEVMLMEGEDQLFCANCNTMTDMEMSCSILELPDVLTLHLQRFYFDNNYMTYKKNKRHIEIPLQLSAQKEDGVHHVYDLYAIVNHTGSLSGGHYFADIKSFEDKQWSRFNDFIVERIQNLYDVRHSDNVVSETACLLFFRKSNALQEKADINLTFMASDESEGPRTNSTSSQIWINPEDSCVQAHQHTELTDSPDENDPDPQSTVSADQDLQDPLNNCETETRSSQRLMDETVENYSRKYNDSETETVRALCSRNPRRKHSTRKIICIGLISLSLVFVCVLIFILVFKS